MTYFDTALRIDSLYSEAWYNKGEALRKQDKYVEAIYHFDKALKIDPSYSKAYSSKGLALKALGRDAEAEEAFARAGLSM
jgi:tetratricopeptide (TPR) repeat protein